MNLLKPIHPEWLPIVQRSLNCVDPNYLSHLEKNPTWLPGPAQLLNAFSLPLSKTNYILFGESPYPRAASANGYAFWDAAVTDIWSETGLSKPVNRATSLRNIIKMLLVAEGVLTVETVNQPAIAALPKQKYIRTLAELFAQLDAKGFLLLNASLVLSESRVQVDAKAWQPFMENILQECAINAPNITLILLGKVAEQINQFAAAKKFKQITATHPYNLSFIADKTMHDFFKPLQLLLKSN